MSRLSIYKVVLQEKIPVLTGNESGRYSSIRSSGLIGSLRWWYEWICHACGQTPCTFKNERVSCKEDNLCRACELFGCTGSSRKFILQTDFEKYTNNHIVNLKYEQQKNNNEIPYPIRDTGKIELRFLFSNRKENDEFVNDISLLIRVIETYGAIGAKTAMGYGVFCIQENEFPKPEKPDWCQSCKQILYGAEIILNIEEIHHIKNLGLNKSAKAKNWMVSASAIRHNLRQLLSDHIKTNLRHGVFGAIRGKWSTSAIDGFEDCPKSSLIKVSHLYKQDGKWCFRIWAFVNEEYHAGAEPVLDLLQNPDQLASKIGEWLNLDDGIVSSVTVFPCNMLEAMKKVCNASSI